MAGKKTRFLNRTQAARTLRVFGWENLTKEQIAWLFQQRQEWTLLDSANVERIAEALESIAKSLKESAGKN